ncbi:MAG: hypothetical protein ACI9MC_001423 [Kiritimatiellia bacterium]|jgi:hypothetical protein
MSTLRPAVLAMALLPWVAFAAPTAPDVPPETSESSEDIVLDHSDTDSVRRAIRDSVSEALRLELNELRDELRLLREDREERKESIESPVEDEEEHALKVVLGHDIHVEDVNGENDLFSFGSSVIIGAGQVVDEAASLGDDVEVFGTVTGDATSIGGDVIVRSGGRVLGDAISLGGEVRIEPGGHVMGEAETVGGAVVVEPGGQLHSMAIRPNFPPQVSWFGGLLSSLYQKLVFLLAFAGAGVMIVALFPERVNRIADVLRDKPLKSGLAGVGWTLGILVVSLLFVWTIIGPIVLLAVLGVAWMIGFVGLCQFLGDRMPFAYKPHGRWLTFLMGSVLMSFLGALPWVGILTVIGASIFGIGAAFITRMGSR